MVCCSVLNCTNNFLNNPARVSFHGFPNDKEVLRYWINFTGKKNFVPKYNSKICSAHFEDDAFVGKSRLKPEAYPTIFSTERNTTFVSEKLHNRISQRIQTYESNKNLKSCFSNPNVAMNKAMMRGGLNETNASHPFEVSNNKVSNIISPNTNLPLNDLPEANNTIVLNYNQNSLGTGAECYVPLKLRVPINLLRMQMPNVRVLGQNPSTTLALSFSNSYTQSITTHTQNQTSQKGPIKVVDMKKLLQPPQEDARTMSTTSTSQQDCEILKHVIHSKETPLKTNVDNESKLQTECTRTNGKNEVALERPSVPSKVAVSQVLDCLKVILPVKFDLAKLIPNDKVAALVIRYLKLQDDSATKNSVVMYLKIIVNAAKVKVKSASSDFNHPYLKINEIALQLALEKVLPPTFAMTDVSNLVLNCLCIVLNQDVYTDGYHILRKLIRKLMNEGQHSNEVSKPQSDMKNPMIKKRTVDEQDGKQPLKRLKFSIIDPHASRMEKLHPKDISVCNVPVTSISEKLQSSNETSFRHNKSTNLKLVSDDAERWEIKSKPWKSKIIVDESLKNKSFDGTPLPKSTFERLGRKNVKKVRVKSDDEEWTPPMGETSFCKNQQIFKKPPEIGSPENIKEIKKYLEKHQCSAKDILSNFKNMFILCRFLKIRSRQSNIQRLNECLIFIAQNKNKTSLRLGEDKITLKQSSNKQKETQRETYTKHLNCNKLRFKPVVVLQDLIDFENKDMLFMKVNKVSSGYYNTKVLQCNQHDISTKKYSSDQVEKLTCESYRKFRKIVIKKQGEKVVFRLKYSKLSPGSLVFVKDFRNPSQGWFKGLVNKMVDSLKYVVQLGSGEVWWCTPEQLRPLPHTETQKPNINVNSRSSRIIKPKQLFDL